MILVDIYIPSLDKTYDFQVDEKVSAGNVIMEITEMIGNETKSGKGMSTEKMLLCSMDEKQIFQRTATLQSCGVKNGSHLMLV